MNGELCEFHACSTPSDLLREEIPPKFLAERRSMGEDVVLLMEESPISFLPTLNTPGRTCLILLAEVTAHSWTLSDEQDGPLSCEELGRELEMEKDDSSVTSGAFMAVVVTLVVE